MRNGPSHVAKATSSAETVQKPSRIALPTFKTLGMWLSWMVEDLTLVSMMAVSSVVFLLRMSLLPPQPYFNFPYLTPY